MIIAFTGTQKGMTERQKKTVDLILSHFSEDTSLIFTHGDCIGADEQAHIIALQYVTRIDIWPCDIKKMRAYCKEGVVHKSMRPLKRNDIIAKRCDLLIAAPKSLNEEQRSGTWATIRYARKYDKPIIILER